MTEVVIIMAEKVDNEIRDIDNEAEVSNLPQEITESYGTGVKEEPGYNIGTRRLRDEEKLYTSTSPELSGGDVDAAWETANSDGEEAVGGTVATPDQNVVDELGAALGVEMDDRSFLWTTEMLERRDERRWDLDPSSSEDYEERKK